MATDQPSALSERHLWLCADAVKPGDRVLDKHGWIECVGSSLCDDGSWLLRFEHGVRYLHPAAPVALCELVA